MNFKSAILVAVCALGGGLMAGGAIAREANEAPRQEDRRQDRREDRREDRRQDRRTDRHDDRREGGREDRSGSNRGRG
jgi:Ni/Co efflux regulator RcnB